MTVNRVLEATCALLLAAAVLVAFLAVIFRYVVGSALSWSTEAPFSLRALAIAFYRAIPALTMPVIILGGILGGIFTPTEASAVAVVYGILVSTLYYRTLTLKTLYETFTEAAVLSGIVHHERHCACRHPVNHQSEPALHRSDAGGAGAGDPVPRCHRHVRSTDVRVLTPGFAEAN